MELTKICDENKRLLDGLSKLAADVDPNTDRHTFDSFCKQHKELYGLNKDGFCIDQSIVRREKCFFCTQYATLCGTSERVCKDAGDNWKNVRYTNLDGIRTNRRGPHK